MKNHHLSLACALVLAMFAAACAGAAEDNKGKLLYHVVCFKYKADASKEQIEQVEKGIKGLKEKIPGIHSVVCGVNNSPEDLAKGFTHAFIVAFESEKARDAYLPHPEHKKVIAVIREVVEDVFVIDFWGDAGK